MTLAAQARGVLTSWTPPDSAQQELRDQYVAHIDSFDDAMYRGCIPGHLTASTLILDHTKERALLTLHPKVGLWLQMGGHCEEPDETLQEAAKREAHEESGIVGLALSDAPVRLDRHRVGCHGGSWHLDVQYVAIAPADAIEQISDESLDLAWFPVNELPELTDDALRALVATALR